MFVLFYFDLGVYIDKIAIEMKCSSENKPLKTPSIHREGKTYNILLHSWFWNVFRCCCLPT